MTEPQGSRFRYETLGSDAEVESLVPVMAESFGHSDASALEFLKRGGFEHIRRLIDEEHAICVAGLIQIPMAHFIRGGRVKALGIAGVGVISTCRRRGAATTLLCETLREGRSRGFALASLYASNQALYRKVGFERAGHSAMFTFSPNIFTAPERTAASEKTAAPEETAGPEELVSTLLSSQRPEDAEARSTVARIYRAYAKDRNGYLDRDDYIWERIYRTRETEVRGLLFHPPGSPQHAEAYVLYRAERKDSARFNLIITDHAAISPRGYRAIATFLAQQGTLVNQVEMRGALDEPLLHLAHDNRYEVTAGEHFYIRVLDPELALTERGYPAHLREQLTLTLTDATLPENDGTFKLEIHDGKGRIDRLDSVAESALELSVTTLAALMTGHQSATQLTRLGLIRGHEAAMALADEIFAADAPALPDMY